MNVGLVWFSYSPHEYDSLYSIYWLVVLTILKNDGVRQREGLFHPIYEMENQIHVSNHQPVYIYIWWRIKVPGGLFMADWWEGLFIHESTNQIYCYSNY